MKKNKHLARQLYLLCKWHKDTCDRENCGISVFPFAQLFKELMGRVPTEKEYREAFL